MIEERRTKTREVVFKMVEQEIYKKREDMF